MFCLQELLRGRDLGHHVNVGVRGICLLPEIGSSAAMDWLGCHADKEKPPRQVSCAHAGVPCLTGGSYLPVLGKL